MTVKSLLALGALSSLGLASAAFAQTPAPAAVVAGPAIPGVCTLNQQKALLTSAVGQSYVTRRNQLVQVVNAELKPEGEWIQGEETQLSAMSREQQQANAPRIKTYVERKQLLERKAQQRDQEIQATEQKQLGRIMGEMRPIIQQVYTERNCGLMLDSTVTVQASSAMDVTDMIVQRLNQKISSITFDRENLGQQAGAAAPAPTAAAAPATTTAAKKKTK